LEEEVASTTLSYRRTEKGREKDRKMEIGVSTPLSYQDGEQLTLKIKELKI